MWCQWRRPGPAKMIHWSLQDVILWLCFVVCVRTHKILLHPLPFMSHCLEMVAIGDELNKRGHEVVLFVPDWFEHRKCIGSSLVGTVRFKVDTTSKEYSKLKQIEKSLKREVFSGKFSIFTSIRLGEELVSLYCHSFLIHHELLTRMRAEGYTLTIEDGRTVSQCLYLLPIALGVPYISVSSLIHHDMSGGVFPGAFYPHIASSFSSTMSGMERLINMFTYIVAPAVVWFFTPVFDKDRYGAMYQNVDMKTLSKRSLLFLENADYVMDYPKALFPNVVQVGGLTVMHPQPLPRELKSYFEASPRGVIVVSLGSLLPDLPFHVVEELVHALGQIHMNVLFKLADGKPMQNIKYVKWFPQNDALADKNCKLFVSHCGINGFYEALYNGVPIVCFPLHGDHFQMAIKVNENKVGRSLDIHKSKSAEIISVINDVLLNNIYRENMLRNMEMIKDKAEPPRQRAARAIEHVARFGAKHITPLSRDLGVIRTANADLWLVVYFILTVMACTCYRVVRKCLRNKHVRTLLRYCFQLISELLRVGMFACYSLVFLFRRFVRSKRFYSETKHKV